MNDSTAASLFFMLPPVLQLVEASSSSGDFAHDQNERDEDCPDDRIFNVSCLHASILHGLDHDLHSVELTASGV